MTVVCDKNPQTARKSKNFTVVVKFPILGRKRRGVTKRRTGCPANDVTVFSYEGCGGTKKKERQERGTLQRMSLNKGFNIQDSEQKKGGECQLQITKHKEGARRHWLNTA